MPNAFDRYRDKLIDLVEVQKVEDASAAMEAAGNDNPYSSDQRVQLPPDTDVEFRAELTNPYHGEEVVNKNLRTANLEQMEFMVIKRASTFLTWIDSFRNDHGLHEDRHITELKNEINKDIGILLNMSVSKKGWLLDNILNPKKRFSFVGDRQERKGILGGRQEGPR